MTPLTITLKRSWDGSWSFGWQTETTSKQWRGGYKDRDHALRGCMNSIREANAWDCDQCNHILDEDGTCGHCRKMKDTLPAKAELS